MENSKMEADEEEDSVDEERKKKSSVHNEHTVQECSNAEASIPLPKGADKNEAMTIEGDALRADTSSKPHFVEKEEVKCEDNLKKEQSSKERNIKANDTLKSKPLENGPNETENNLPTTENHLHDNITEIKGNTLATKTDDTPKMQGPEQPQAKKDHANVDKVSVAKKMENVPASGQNINVNKGSMEVKTSQSTSVDETNTTATLQTMPQETESNMLGETNVLVSKTSSDQPVNGLIELKASDVALKTDEQKSKEIIESTSEPKIGMHIKEENHISQTKSDDSEDDAKGSKSEKVVTLSPQRKSTLSTEVLQVKQNNTIQESILPKVKAVSKEPINQKQTATLKKEEEKKPAKTPISQSKGEVKLDTNQSSHETIKRSPSRQNKEFKGNASKNARSPNSMGHMPLDSLSKTNVSNQKSLATQGTSIHKSKKYEKELVGNAIKSSETSKQIKPVQGAGQNNDEQSDSKSELVSEELPAANKKPTQESKKGTATPKKIRVKGKEVEAVISDTVKQNIVTTTNGHLSQDGSSLPKQVLSDEEINAPITTEPMLAPCEEIQQSSSHRESRSPEKEALQSETTQSIKQENTASTMKDTSESKTKEIKHTGTDLLKQTPTDTTGKKIKTESQNIGQSVKKELTTQKFDSKAMKSEQENKVNPVKSTSSTKQPKITNKGFVDAQGKPRSEKHTMERKSDAGIGLSEQKKHTDIKKVSLKEIEKKEHTNVITPEQKRSADVTSDKTEKELIHNTNYLRDMPVEKKIEEKTYKSEPKKKSETTKEGLQQKPQHTSNKDCTVNKEVLQGKEMNKISTTHSVGTRVDMVPGISRPIPKGTKQTSADEVSTVKNKEKLGISIPKSKPEKKTGAQRDVSPRKTKEPVQKNIPKQDEKSSKNSKFQTEKKTEIAKDLRNYKLTDSKQMAALGMKDGRSTQTSTQKTTVNSKHSIKKDLTEENTMNNKVKVNEDDSSELKTEAKKSSDEKMQTISSNIDKHSNNDSVKCTDKNNVISTSTANILHGKDESESKEKAEAKEKASKEPQKEQDDSKLQTSLMTVSKDEKNGITNDKRVDDTQIPEGQLKKQTYQKIQMDDSHSQSDQLYKTKITTQTHSSHTEKASQVKKAEETFQRSQYNTTHQKPPKNLIETTRPLVQESLSGSAKVLNQTASQNAKPEVITQEPKDKRIKDETVINVQDAMPSKINSNKTGLPQKDNCVVSMREKEEPLNKNIVMHKLEGNNDKQQTKQQSEQQEQRQNEEQPEEDNSSSGCGIQGRSCPIYFGVKSYLHHFYDSTPSKSRIYEETVQEDDFEYLVDPNKGRRRGCCKGFWFRAGLWGGVNLLLVGVIALLVGYLTPQREMVIAYHDELEILDRWAITFNRRLELCRLAGLAVFCCGGLVLLVTLLLSTFLHNNSKCCCDDSYHYATTPMVEQFIGNQNKVSPIVPSSSKIPITEKIKSVQPSIWPEIATVKDGSLVVQMP